MIVYLGLDYCFPYVNAKITMPVLPDDGLDSSAHAALEDEDTIKDQEEGRMMMKALDVRD